MKKNVDCQRRLNEDIYLYNSPKLWVTIFFEIAMD